MIGQFHDHAQNARTCTEASKGQLCPRATVFWKHDGLYSNVQFESGLKRAAGGVNIVICRLFEFNRHSNEIEAVSIKKLTVVWSCLVYFHNRNFCPIVHQSRVEYIAVAVLPMPETSPQIL